MKRDNGRKDYGMKEIPQRLKIPKHGDALGFSIDDLLDNDFRSPDDVHAALRGVKALALQVVDGGTR